MLSEHSNFEVWNFQDYILVFINSLTLNLKKCLSVLRIIKSEALKTIIQSIDMRTGLNLLLRYAQHDH